ncbi:MAG TPA: AraC family transcriptional regulator [Thermoanaerobaculia bacterium]|nr:AraC family transcriptional regulator [Thermoanaerobaculia bacterium]
METRTLAAQARRLHEVAGLTLSTTLHEPGTALARHEHERPYFCFVLGGAFDESDGRQSHRCATGTLVFHPAGDRHADRFGAAAARCLNVELPREWQAARGALAPAFESRAQRDERRLGDIASRLHRELLCGDAASELAMQGIALELAAEWSRTVELPSATRTQSWLSEAERIVRDDFRSRIEFGAVAARVGVHPVHLSREFRRAHRMTMTEFVSRLRVDFAAERIRATDLPLACIALDAGFADQSHLSKVFRRFTGTTCLAYRHANRRAN